MSQRATTSFFFFFFSIVYLTLINKSTSGFTHIGQFNSTYQLLLYSTGSCFKFYRFHHVHGLDRDLGEVLLPLNGSISCHDEDRLSISAFDYFYDENDQLNLIWINSNDATVRSARLHLFSSSSSSSSSSSTKPSLIDGRILYQFNASLSTNSSQRFLSRSIALDRLNHRLFVAQERSQSLYVVDLETGFNRLIAINSSLASQLMLDSYRNRFYWLQNSTSVWALDLKTQSSYLIFPSNSSSNQLSFSVDQSTGNMYILNQNGILLKLNHTASPPVIEMIQALDFKSRKITRPSRLLILPGCTNSSSSSLSPPQFLFADLDQRRSRLYQVQLYANDSVTMVRPQQLFMDSKICDVRLISIQSSEMKASSLLVGVGVNGGLSLPVVETVYLRLLIVIGLILLTLTLLLLLASCLFLLNKYGRFLNPKSAFRCRFWLSSCPCPSKDKRLLTCRNSDLI